MNEESSKMVAPALTRRKPTRQCVGCRTRGDQRALVRIEVAGKCRGLGSHSACGKVQLRLSQLPLQGRGAYVHERADCVRRMNAGGTLEHAFRTGRGTMCVESVQDLSALLLKRSLSRNGPDTIDAPRGRAGHKGAQLEDGARRTKERDRLTTEHKPTENSRQSGTINHNRRRFRG